MPGRKAGVRNRNYPPLKLEDALRVPRAIQDQAGGIEVGRLTLADLLDVSPGSSGFSDAVAASRLFGLTNGGINADTFSLTETGDKATGGDEVAQVAALKSAVMNIAPYKAFFEAFRNKKVPSDAVLREFLPKNAGVPVERVDECIEFMRADGRTAGLIRVTKGGDYIDLEGAPALPEAPQAERPEADDEDIAPPAEDEAPPAAPLVPETPAAPKKVFIAHGKNRTPLEQLKKALDQFKVKYAVAVDEPNKGRPISKKVADLMQDECSSGIFIFTADERFLREKGGGEPEEVWRPSENVVFELGAASILYENRIVIFKEKGVSFPSDFSDLGYIEFEKDQPCNRDREPVQRAGESRHPRG